MNEKLQGFLPTLTGQKSLQFFIRFLGETMGSYFHSEINRPLTHERFLTLDHSGRAWVSTGAAGAWHLPKFWTSPLAPADFEVFNTNWHPQSSFYVTSGTLSFKFLTQALSCIYFFDCFCPTEFSFHCQNVSPFLQNKVIKNSFLN